MIVWGDNRLSSRYLNLKRRSYASGFGCRSGGELGHGLWPLSVDPSRDGSSPSAIGWIPRETHGDETIPQRGWSHLISSSPPPSPPLLSHTLQPVLRGTPPDWPVLALEDRGHDHGGDHLQPLYQLISDYSQPNSNTMKKAPSRLNFRALAKASSRGTTMMRQTSGHCPRIDLGLPENTAAHAREKGRRLRAPRETPTPDCKFRGKIGGGAPSSRREPGWRKILLRSALLPGVRTGPRGSESTGERLAERGARSGPGP